MTDRLPLFPLRTVLFPGMLLPLHVFELRYRLLVRRCLQSRAPFGIALIKSGPEVGGPAEPHRVGTTARIVDATELPREHALVVVRGEQRFEVEEVVPDAEPYLVARVRYLREEMGEDALRLAADAAEAYGEYQLALATMGGGAPTLRERREPPSPRDAAYEIAAGLVIEAAERQRLLELSTLSDLLGAELRILERENALLREVLVRQRAKGKGPPLH